MLMDGVQSKISVLKTANEAFMIAKGEKEE
jgi:hypothetical protein